MPFPYVQDGSPCGFVIVASWREFDFAARADFYQSLRGNRVGSRLEHRSTPVVLCIHHRNEVGSGRGARAATHTQVLINDLLDRVSAAQDDISTDECFKLN